MDSDPVILSGYAAKTCARAIHNSYDVTIPRQVEVVPPEVQALFDLGIAHELDVFDVWLRAGNDVVDLRPCDSRDGKAAHIAATIEAMQHGRLVILGGRLPDDLAGGRGGKPDVLLQDIGRPGYHPADVKAHLVLKQGKTGGLVADLRSPALATAVAQEAVGLRHDMRDLLQLAHYWRMLESCGFAAVQPWGAIIGTDSHRLPTLAWYDLNEPVFTTFSRSQGKTSRSSLERYDHEHDFRVRVARVAQQRTGDAADPEPLVQPVGQDDCRNCAWAPVCVDLLAPDDLSRELRGALTVREYLALRAQGVTTVDELADADIERLLDSPYADETSHQHARAKRLYQAHMSAQLARDGVVLRLKPDAIFDVPSSDLEVDIDMESGREGLIYLWGVLVTENGMSTYHAFGDRNVATALDELALARRCFDWLVANCPAATVFHYGHVERSNAIRILGAGAAAYDGTVAEPATWVDQHPMTRACLDDPGGRQSQLWLDEARAGHDEAWQRNLDYNEDDVRATLAVRQFLRAALG
jgi:hypothetical protein